VDSNHYRTLIPGVNTRWSIIVAKDAIFQVTSKYSPPRLHKLKGSRN